MKVQKKTPRKMKEKAVQWGSILHNNLGPGKLCKEVQARQVMEEDYSFKNKTELKLIDSKLIIKSILRELRT